MFCRLLGALRDVDYIGRQRKESEYKNWLMLASNFTRDAFLEAETPANSMHYLLLFWSRLVVTARAGLPRHVFPPEQLTNEALKAEIDRRFPDFENNGWRFDAAYTEPLPEGLRSDLARFFAPHNELLFDWMGARLAWPAE